MSTIEKKASVSSAAIGIGLSKPSEQLAIADGNVVQNGTHKSTIKVAVNQQNGKDGHDDHKKGKERSESPPPLECEKEAEEKKKKQEREERKKQEEEAGKKK